MRWRLPSRRSGFDPAQSFYVPPEAGTHLRSAVERGASQESEWSSAVRELREGAPGSRGGVAARAGRRAAGGLGPRPRRSSGEGRAGDAPVVGQGPERHRRRACPSSWAETPTSRCRPARRSRTGARSTARAAPAETFTTACASTPWGDRERHGLPRRCPSFRRDLLLLLGLHAPRGAPRGVERAAGDLRVDARLDRARRGRSDASARRALDVAARDARPRGHASGRCERVGGGMAVRDHAAPSPGGVGPEPAEAAGDRREGGTRCGARRIRRRRSGEGPAGRDPDGHRRRGARCACGASTPRGRGRGDPRRLDAVLGGICRSKMPSIVRRSFLPPSRRASPSKRASRSAGNAGSATVGAPSVSIVTVPRRRARSTSSGSGSRPRTSRSTSERSSATREAADDRRDRVRSRWVPVEGPGGA